MELHTNRAAKHRYGKQRCKTSDMTFSFENMNLQIRSMFDGEPTSAELISSRKRFVKRPFHQWNTQASNATPWKRMALEKRTPTTHIPAQAELHPPESGDNSTKQGGMPKLPKGGSTHQKKTALTLFHKKKKRTYIAQELPRTRTT